MPNFIVPQFISDALDLVTDAKDSLVDMVQTAGAVSGHVACEIKDYVVENPGTSAAIATSTIVTGGVAFAAAPAIAAAAGGAGMLGAASTGTAISTLSGAALSNASLAALGGGALTAGGGGMAAGTAVIAGTGAATGLGASTAIVKAKGS